MLKKVVVTMAIVAGVSGLLLIGCGESGGADKHLVIFSQCNNAEPYRAAQNKLMQKLCAKYDDIKLVIKDGQQDNSKQIAQIETSIRQKPAVLIVAPNERNPLTEVMGKAVKAGIPTICLERDIVKPNYTTYIRCDNRKIGRMAGEFIVEHLKKKYDGEAKGKIVELQGLLGVEGEENRREGAHEIFDKYPDVKVVHKAVADWLQGDARERMTEILNAQPQIDVCYGHNDPMAIGAYLAAKDKQRADEMIFVGVDGLGGPAGGIKKVKDGVLACTFYYPLCVDKAVELTDKILHQPDFEPKKTYTMKTHIITPENCEEMYKKYTFE